MVIEGQQARWYENVLTPASGQNQHGDGVDLRVGLMEKRAHMGRNAGLEGRTRASLHQTRV